MKLLDVKSSTCTESSKEIDNKDPIFIIGDNVRIPKYKNTFAKDYVSNWPEEVLLLQKLKKLCSGHMLLVVLKVKKLLEPFKKTNCKKKIEKSLELKK